MVFLTFYGLRKMDLYFCLLIFFKYNPCIFYDVATCHYLSIWRDSETSPYNCMRLRVANLNRKIPQILKPAI